jgi:transposase
VNADNLVRIIDAFVDELDLAELAFERVQPAATGRPGYAPGTMLRLCIYEYLVAVPALRRRGLFRAHMRTVR